MSESKDNEVKNDKMDLDRILEEVGQFGWFQLRIILLAAIMVAFSGWGANEYIFSAARIKSRCLIPECDYKDPEFSPSWIIHAIPSTSASAGSLDSCYRYGINTTNVAIETCTPEIFNTDVLLPCEDYVYENTNTVVYDFNLACNEWKRAFIGSIRLFGTLTALLLTGYISDRWGRKTAFLFNTINSSWLGVIRYWTTSYTQFVISEFLEATFGFGTYSTACILIMEVVGPKYRVAAGATMTTFYSIGSITLGLIAWAVPQWRNLTLALYIPQFLSIFNIWLISESLRWTMCKGRYSELETLLHKIAKINGKKLHPKSLQQLKQTAQEENKETQTENRKTSTWLIVSVFRNKPVLYRVLISPILWITTTLVYYGMSVNAVNMSGNSYVNFMAVNAAGIPGYLTAVLLMDRIGRKPVLAGAFWICCACQVAYIFMPTNMYGLSLTAYLIGKSSISIVATGIYVYTAELYPTEHRHALFGFSCMTGRIGSILSPLTPAIGVSTFDEMPFIIFGSCALLAGILILTTPETLGTKLPDSMEDAKVLGRNRCTNSNTDTTTF